MYEVDDVDFLEDLVDTENVEGEPAIDAASTTLRKPSALTQFWEDFKTAPARAYEECVEADILQKYASPRDYKECLFYYLSAITGISSADPLNPSITMSSKNICIVFYLSNVYM